MGSLETSCGGADRAFPSTRWSRIQAAREAGSPEHREALEQLSRSYWKPVYAYLRAVRRLPNEDAKDLAQEFFLELVEGGLLVRFSPQQGSFRNYLRGAVRLFLLEHHEREGRLKRGGGRKIFSMDDDRATIDEPGSTRTPEELFDLQWAESVFHDAVDRLRDESESAGQGDAFRIFDRYELSSESGETPSYSALAAEFGIKETDVENRLKHCRKRFRALILDRIRDTVSTEVEVTAELSDILDILGRR